MAQNTSGRRSAIDRRTTRHPGYAMSQRIRKRIEEAFGWIKTVAGLRKTRFRGLARVDRAFTLRGRRLQSGAVAEAHGGGIAMTAPTDRRLIGRWRIVEADIWGRPYLDLVEPAMMVIGPGGHGEIVFGALQAGLDLAYGRCDVAFTWAGCDEMDEVSGSGSAELLEDCRLEVEFDYDDGDEAILKAARVTSSTAC